MAHTDRWKCFLALLATACVMQAAVAQDVDRMDQIVQSYVKDHQFMGAVLVAKGDKILFNRAYGSANIEWDISNTPTTKFRLGSVTKQFTAAAILLLEERGKLKLDQPVSTYLPDTPPAWQKIIVSQLLTHTSGIPNVTSQPQFANMAPLTKKPNEIIDLVRDMPLEFQPGEQYRYSNTGYIILGAIIEKQSGQSYQNFLQANIFQPLGMADTGYDSNRTVMPRRASGYAHDGDHFVNASFIDMSIPFSAGALYSTTGDLLRWQQGLYGGKVLSAESLKKMTTPFKDDYALGLVVKTHGGSREFFHGGSIFGFNTSLSYRPNEELSIIVLSNLEKNITQFISGRISAVALH